MTVQELKNRLKEKYYDSKLDTEVVPYKVYIEDVYRRNKLFKEDLGIAFNLTYLQLCYLLGLERSQRKKDYVDEHWREKQVDFVERTLNVLGLNVLGLRKINMQDISYVTTEIVSQ